ncbi:platelet-activating factor receptor [Biomphalaria glabrata]|nr:platelet-activating factor receptor [Biomphalaria glabrata]
MINELALTTESSVAEFTAVNVSAYTSYFPPGSLEILTLVDFIIIYTIISVLGIIANFINIVVFVKMGPQDSVNISLLGLSISDFLFLLLTLFLSICYYPFWTYADLNFNIVDMKMLTLGWPQFYFKRVGNWITAFIMLERCICIALPLKVKDIITPKRTIAILVLIYLMMALAISPAYVSASYQPRWDSKKNRTMIVFVFHENTAQIDAISTAISFALTLITFVWVVICTFILVINLKIKGKWRKEMTGHEKSRNVTSRDQKVIKMVTLLSIIFIISFTPDVIVLLFMTFDYRVSIYGDYFDLFLALNGISEPFLAISATVNIFVYLTMSSKYREIYMRYFYIHRKCQKV